MQTHEHTLTLTGAMITTVEYMARSFHAGEESSSDTPPVTVTHDGTAWTLTTHCEHAASADVATDFNGTCEDALHIMTTAADGALAAELNFCYGVVVTFAVGMQTYEVDLFIGQGTTAGQSDWWLGGANVINDVNPLLALISYNQISKLLHVSSAPNAFDFALPQSTRTPKTAMTSAKAFLQSCF